MSHPTKGSVMAFAAAMMAVSSSTGAANNPPGSTGAAIAASDQVHCYGLTACHSVSLCASATAHDRALGIDRSKKYQDLTAKQCLDIGGTIRDIESRLQKDRI